MNIEGHNIVDEEAYQNNSHETIERELIQCNNNDGDRIGAFTEDSAYEVLEEEQLQIREEPEGADN